MDERLRPTERLRNAGEFREVFSRGRCFRTPCLRIHYFFNDREISRVGLVVSRRVGKAVVRSRVRRLLREVFRRNKKLLRSPADVVLIPQGAPGNHAAYEAAFRLFAEKSGGRHRKAVTP